MKIPNIIEEYKHLYGTYATMALRNIQIILDHIQKVAALPSSDNDNTSKSENFWEHRVMLCLKDETYSTNVYHEKTAMIIEKLLHCFPFLKTMADSRRIYINKKYELTRQEINSNDIFYILNNLFRVLKRYRDYTLHYMISESSFDDSSKFLEMNETPLSHSIHEYYTAALRNTKERYRYTTEDLSFIQEHRINKKTKKRNLDFFLSMQSHNDDKTDKLHLSGVGVAQLICFFLEKKYINQFISNLPINKDYNQSTKEYKIIQRSLSINSIRLPKERIHSEKKELSIALDMLNELKRCPKELFDTLSQNDQDNFRIMSSDGNEVILMRHTDRFAQLSLQYIDCNHLFNRIRFHVNMGKLRYLFQAEKKCIDGNSRVRVLEHSLNGFGRLNEMEQYRNQNDVFFGDSNIKIRDFENIQRDDDYAENYPYIVDTYTHYILDNNKIEMYFTDDKIVPKIYKTGDKHWRVNKPVPRCRLSTLELPSMMFHMHLLGNKKTEQRIINVYNNYKRLFKALSNGTLTEENIDSFGIDQCDMPQQVIDSISGKNNTKSLHSHTIKTIDELIEETNRLIENLKLTEKRINSKFNKLGSRNYKSIKPGKLADFLAKDIVRFQPSLEKDESYGTDRITSLNYRVMQASIALYNSINDENAFDKFYNMFKYAKLVEDKKRSHPFLHDVLKRHPKNTIEFYKHYLIARKKYLNQIERKIKKPQKNSKSLEFIKKLPFINHDKKKWRKRNDEYYKIIGEIYVFDIPIELPRQMFDKEIKEALKTRPEMQDIDFDNANITYLISEYIKRVHNDESQGFYYWKRNYRYIDMLQCTTLGQLQSIEAKYTNTSERINIWINRAEYEENYRQWAKNKKKNGSGQSCVKNQEEEIIKKKLQSNRIAYQKSEKHIRRYKVQDILMYLIIKDTLTKNISFSAKDFKLEDILPNAEHCVLSETMPIDFIFEKNGNRYTIKSNGLKLKNYGDFFSLAHDKRLLSLFKILNTEIASKEMIEQEFDNYDHCRPQIIRLMLDFEKMAYDKHLDLKNYVDKYEHFDFKKLLAELERRNDINTEQKEVLRLIRNAFAHNEYPDPRKCHIEIKTLPEIANYLKNTFNNYTQVLTY